MKKKPAAFLAVAVLLLAVFGAFVLPPYFEKRQYWSSYAPTKQGFPLLTFVAESIERAYSYLDLKQDVFGFEWHDLRSHYAQSVSAAADAEERLFLVDELLALLDDGHTWLDHPTSGLDLCLPLAIERKDNGLRVDSFTADLAATAPWLETGTVLLSVDDRPATELWQQLEQAGGYHLLQSHDLQLGKRFWQSYWFYLRRDTERPEMSTLQFQDSNGRIWQHELLWQPADSLRTTYGVQVKRGSAKTFTWELLADGKLGYIQVPSFSRGISEQQIDQAFRELADVEGLIIDLRDNGGGSFTRYGTRILSHLVPSASVVSSKEFRLSQELHLFGSDGLDYPGKADGSGATYSEPISNLVQPANGVQFRGKPVVLLVNDACFSSADTFIATFSDLQLGPIIGRTDALHSGQPIAIAVPNTEYVLHLSSIINRSASGQIVEGRQIELERTIPWSRGDILSQSDPVLEAALEMLTGK